MQVHKYASIQVRKHASWKVYKYASMQVWKCEGMLISTLKVWKYGNIHVQEDKSI